MTFFHDGAEQLQQDSWTEGYLTYMENPEKTTGLFTVGKEYPDTAGQAKAKGVVYPGAEKQ